MARHPAVVLAARELKSWIGELPLANPPRTASQVLQQLRLLVRDPDPGSRLGNLLDIYAPPIDSLLDMVGERMQNNPDNAIPLDQLEYQVVEILNELADGYMRVANDVILNGKHPSAETLFRAMSALERGLTVKRLHYQQRTPDNWSNQLRIFLRAENQNISSQAMKPPICRDGEADTIRSLFYTSLIIGLCDPNQRRPREIIEWTEWIAGKTTLLQLNLLPQGAFAIPIDVSGELAPLCAARQAKPGPDTRYLVTDDFMRAAKAEMPGLHRALSQLINGRRVADQRGSARHSRNHPYRLVFGLRAIYQRLSALTRGLEQTELDHHHVEALQINQSKHGAAFELAATASHVPLSVGEPALAEAVVNPGNAPIGFAAILQRLVNLDGQTIEIGVEKMRGRLIPVLVQTSSGERNHLDPHALLQQNTETGQYLLLASRGWYRPNDHVNVEGPNARYRLRLVRLVSELMHTVRIEVEITSD